jgi:hypothetical protein
MATGLGHLFAAAVKRAGPERLNAGGCWLRGDRDRNLIARWARFATGDSDGGRRRTRSSRLNLDREGQFSREAHGVHGVSAGADCGGFSRFVRAFPFGTNVRSRSDYSWREFHSDGCRAVARRRTDVCERDRELPGPGTADDGRKYVGSVMFAGELPTFDGQFVGIPIGVVATEGDVVGMFGFATRAAADADRAGGCKGRHRFEGALNGGGRRVEVDR